MTPAAKEGLPAVVGELVAKWDAEADRYAERLGSAATMPSEVAHAMGSVYRACAKQLQALSALTAEAGKGEVTDAMVEAAAEAVWNATSHKLLAQAGYPTDWPSINPSNRRSALREARIALTAALSTATPAGERDRIEAAAIHLYGHHAGNHPTIHCNRFPSWDELTQAQRIEWRKKAMLAASPRGANAGEG
jgi:hypothetical protein